MAVVTPSSATVPVTSAWASKINWTQAVAIIAAVLAFFGFDLDTKTQAELLAAIPIVQGVVTWALRTFFTKSVTPASLK